MHVHSHNQFKVFTSTSSTPAPQQTTNLTKRITCGDVSRVIRYERSGCGYSTVSQSQLLWSADWHRLE